MLGTVSTISTSQLVHKMVQTKAQYLQSIIAVRERTSWVHEKALNNNLTNFDVDLSQLEGIATYVITVIKRDYGTQFSSIPPHGRWQHFEAGDIPRISDLTEQWTDEGVSDYDITKRLLDLFLVSVLLDAGAGNKWSYTEPSTGIDVARSEGLAVASLDMFKDGAFSSNPDNLFQVDGKKLVSLTTEELAKGLQVTEENPLQGLEGRAALLARLGNALIDSTEYFGQDSRPGNLLDYLLNHETTKKDESSDNASIVQLTTLWDALMDGLSSIWPEGRTQLDGISLGDAWNCSSMPQDQGEWASIVPFHKLTQWLCYSLLTPMKKFMGIEFEGEDLQTGLPEYRNGGLLVDLGLLTLKPDVLQQGLENAEKLSNGQPVTVPVFSPDSDVIIEWRAATIGFLDLLLEQINLDLADGVPDVKVLNLAQLLEAGTWKSGREIAAQLRPDTNGPPIEILSDGTVF